MVFAHGNHELFAAGLIQLYQPEILYLTCSSDSENDWIEAQVRTSLQSLGFEGCVTFLPVTEQEIYRRMLARDISWFAELRDRVGTWLSQLRPEVVFTDAFEWYNSVHDLCPLLVDAAIDSYKISWLRVPRRYDLPLAFQTTSAQRISGSDTPDFFILKHILTAEQSRRKRELVQHLTQVDASVQDATSTWKQERYEREFYRSVPLGRDYRTAPLRDAWKTYDDHGLDNVRRGRYQEAILFHEHYVLIVNRCLGSRTGTELYVRDLAIALQRQGHCPTVFSPKLGLLADDLKSHGLSVFDRLEEISTAPDVIHGHHTWETMAALVQFPEVPAVFVGHDATAWHDTPPRMPQIGHYIAVDYTLLDRFVESHGIEPNRVTVVPNPIAFAGFRKRGALPARPRRALQISGYSGTHERDEIEAACSARGIQLDSIGHHFGNTSTNPEALFADYDLVFAKGRCAFEAAAAGAAVVFCDTWGCGPLLSNRVLDEGHGILTGRRMLAEEFSTPVLLERIDQYDANDAAEVSQRVHDIFDAESVTARLVDLYRDVIAKHELLPEKTAQLGLQQELLWWAANFDRVLQEQNEAGARMTPRRRTASSIEVGSSVDFAHPFRGAGWYAPERDGHGYFCWLGPEPTAWLELRVPEGRLFCLHCEIAYVHDPELFEHLELFVAGQRVDIEHIEGESIFSIRGKLPMNEPIVSGNTIRVELKLPKTTCPSDVNVASTDDRPLGVAVRAIAIEADDEALIIPFNCDGAGRSPTVCRSKRAA
ncbi:unnamed protein product [Cladocopium goreaui]|uniref:Glycosyltransferase subfamily 4-like N-terminal domain-containing protein n=1 Tax=Cladocopium goreaui TaxID=2562237 RepID=A0A9P1BEP4_9DINO|nr:unnamed protein product [Cladocopium goreaui]